MWRPVFCLVLFCFILHRVTCVVFKLPSRDPAALSAPKSQDYAFVFFYFSPELSSLEQDSVSTFTTHPSPCVVFFTWKTVNNVFRIRIERRLSSLKHFLGIPLKNTGFKTCVWSRTPEVCPSYELGRWRSWPGWSTTFLYYLNHSL